MNQEIVTLNNVEELYLKTKLRKTRLEMEQLELRSEEKRLLEERTSMPYPAPPEWSPTDKEQHGQTMKSIFERTNALAPKLVANDADLERYLRAVPALEKLSEELPLVEPYKQEAEEAQAIFDEAKLALERTRTEQQEARAAYVQAVNRGDIAEGAKLHSRLFVYEDVLKVAEISLKRKLQDQILKSQRYRDLTTRLSSWQAELPVGELLGNTAAAA